jgi:hypothetical protein
MAQSVGGGMGGMGARVRKEVWDVRVSPKGCPLSGTARFLFFSRFSFGFPFIEFCSLRHFEVSNSVLTKNLEIGSSFFRIFILKFFKFTNQFTENQ